jgi:hypothetical protein
MVLSWCRQPLPDTTRQPDGTILITDREGNEFAVVVIELQKPKEEVEE